MKATQILVDEHKAIKLMLAVLGRIAGRLETNGEVSPEDLARAVDFIREFADKCHHAKEEDLLFPAMERAGIPRERGPIGVMLAEHEQGRALVRAMNDAIPGVKANDPVARQAFADAGRNYAALLAQHIDKEDNILYQMADARVPAAEQERLLADFDRVEREITGPGKHEQYHALVHDLDKLY